MTRKPRPLPPGWSSTMNTEAVKSNKGSYERVKRKYKAAFMPVNTAIGEVAKLTGLSTEVLATKMARGRPSGAKVAIVEARQILAWFLTETTTLNQREVANIIGMTTSSVNRNICEVKRLNITNSQLDMMLKLGYNGEPWYRQGDTLKKGKTK
jgi:hypothetical protein